MKTLLTVSTLFLLLTVACDREVVPDPHIPTDTHNCAPACANLQRLSCPEGDDLEVDGKVVTCADFCEETQKKGHALNPTCVAKINTCGAIDTCLFKGNP